MSNEIIKRLLSSLVIIPISLFFIINGSYYFNLFLIIFFLISSYEWYKLTGNKILTFFGIIFLFLSTYSAYLLRGDTKENLLLFILIILICVATDIGGFFFGKLFKGPKLTKISPNKTYSGAICGYLLSILAGYIFLYNYNILNNDINFLISVVLISTVSQLGDLSISYFKRLYKRKNTGNLIPGHGGILDRTDGIIFATPFSYIFLIII
tara:strand:- start:512 stop:1141 length:630 start_codon:yes stop_codon:yes gene_type:complete